LGELSFQAILLRQKFARPLSQWKKAGRGVYACHPTVGRKLKIGGEWFRLAWAKSKTLPPK
jgi:hypothetical protein